MDSFSELVYNLRSLWGLNTFQTKCNTALKSTSHEHGIPWILIDFRIAVDHLESFTHTSTESTLADLQVHTHMDIMCKVRTMYVHTYIGIYIRMYRYIHNATGFGSE